MDQLAIPVGEVLRDVGMARTLAAEPDPWLAEAIAALRIFSQIPCWSTFKMEDFRAWYLARGYPAPHSHKCWGALTTRASNAGVINFTGRYAASVSPKTHAHPVKVWSA